MNVLFVCSANKPRSKTADDYFSVNFSEHTFMSTWTTFLEGHAVPDGRGAGHGGEAPGHGENLHNVKVLGIPDDFRYMRKELINGRQRAIMPHESVDAA
jgi:predicted protein tyrosine phosphatase